MPTDEMGLVLTSAKEMFYNSSSTDKIGLAQINLEKAVDRIKTYIFHKQVHFTNTKTYLVFLNAANTIAIFNTCSGTNGDRNRLVPQTQNSFYSFTLRNKVVIVHLF